MLTEYYFAVRYGDIIILLYHEDMMSVWELLFKNSQKEKALKRFLEYCYMIDVKVAFEGLKGEKTKGLKATQTFECYFNPLVFSPFKQRVKGNS